MSKEITVIPSIQAHYEDILKIFNQGFSSKFRFVTRETAKQLSFARDFDLFDFEPGDREFSAIIHKHILGFLSLRFSGQIRHKHGNKLTYRKLYRKYGFICIIKAILISIAFYHKPKEGELYIDTIGVAAEARGQGIGTYLLDFAESFAKENNLGKLTLMVIYENPKAKALYERCGYRIKSSYSLWWMRSTTGISGAYYMVKYL